MLQLRTLRVRQQQPATPGQPFGRNYPISAVTRGRPPTRRRSISLAPCVTPLDLLGKDVQPPVGEVSVMIGRRYAPKARAAIVYWGGMEWPEIYVRLTRDRNDV